MHSLRFMRLGALGAVGLSAASAVDTYGRSEAFCGPGGGCRAVAASDLGQLIGDLLPGLGLGGYTAIFIASLSAAAALRKLSLWTAVAGGVCGVFLLALQAYYIGAFCGLCVAVDLSAVVVGLLAVVALRSDWTAPTSWPPSAWAALYVIAAGTLPAYAISRPEPVPEQVQRLQQQGRINVIEFSDFECPYCRALHPVLAQAMAPYQQRVHFVRMAYPLVTHRHAARAARAYLCGAQQDQGEPMADALYASEDLSRDGLTAIAAATGLDMRAFEACMKRGETAAEVRAQRALGEAANIHGLPTVWIDDRVIVGFRKAAGARPYAEALRAAAEGKRATHRAWPWLVIGAIALLLVSRAARTLRRRHAAG